jgi:hypothetical protein
MVFGGKLIFWGFSEWLCVVGKEGEEEEAVHCFRCKEGVLGFAFRLRL